MILTGSEIEKAFYSREIDISPFHSSLVNPNSYNYRLGNTLKEWVGQENDRNIFKTIKLTDEGYILKPHTMYLGHTLETIGSSKYAMSLIGRSSLGRLGLFLQISANLGHTTSCHRWTLEIVATQPIKIYPGMKIGQVSFWQNQGEIVPRNFTYANFNGPQESLVIAAQKAE